MKAFINPEYGKKYMGEVLRTYNNGEVIIVHPLYADDPELSVKIDAENCTILHDITRIETKMLQMILDVIVLARPIESETANLIINIENELNKRGELKPALYKISA